MDDWLADCFAGVWVVNEACAELEEEMGNVPIDPINQDTDDDDNGYTWPILFYYVQ